MKIFLLNQKSKFTKHLNFLKDALVMDYDKNQLAKKSTIIAIDTKTTITDLNFDFLFDYKIFPIKILSSFTEWNMKGRKMKSGDTIVQQLYLPPIPKFSQKIIVGVRINEIINKPLVKGFSYETLRGHVEKGISTFTIEQNQAQLIAKIQTYSKPANLLAKIVGPFFSIPYQNYCTKSALKNIKRQIENQK